LVAAGALPLDAAQDVARLSPAGWGLRFPSDLTILACSRALLEWAIRRRVEESGRVRFLPETDVTRLLPDTRGAGVSGLMIRSREAASGGPAGEQALLADFVVDASGRSSRLPQWLEGLGYEPPEESVVDTRQGYASRLFRRPAGAPADWKALLVAPAPPDGTRFGVFVPVEGDRWIASLGGNHGDYPPTDAAGYMAFARTLPTPLFAEAIEQAEPLSSIHGSRSTASRWRRCERAIRWPDRLVALGDAVCAVSPANAQGMTAAAIGAITLDACLREQRRRSRGGLSGLSRRFQRRLAKVISVPWTLATSDEIRYGGVEAVSPRLIDRWRRAYLERLARRATGDARLSLAMLEVFHLLRPPSTLFRPSVLIAVLAGACRQPARPAPAERKSPVRAEA
jgi:2-polyprenyl-6-methoxyphenol hydroxylase-like FAD-dependent oxidoreductase